MPEVKWFDKPQDHDFPAAGDYLALIADPQVVAALTDKLRASYHTDENTDIPVVLAVPD